MSKAEKRKIAAGMTTRPEDFLLAIKNLDHPDREIQDLLDQFSENTIANFPVPFGVAPNFLINDKFYLVPMAIEESSVVAAASAAAGFWAKNGGFRARVIDTLKIGQLHFSWQGKTEILKIAFPDIREYLLLNTEGITERMRERGGGIKDIQLEDFSLSIPGYYQLKVFFETADSMGANFINTCLEEMGRLLKEFLAGNELFVHESRDVEIIMAILSNYTPECLVECYVEADVSVFDNLEQGVSGLAFVDKFCRAVQIAAIDRYRAVTHNKGIFNGTDAVVIATGNDFRAVEAAGHAYASRDGSYRSLSYASAENGKFRFGLTLPLALGTVGGLTGLHPMAKWSFEILGRPGARELMMIAAAAGLANNYSAIKSLITKGIQQGHMKMHLGNILSALNATEGQRNKALEHFAEHKVSFDLVRKFIDNLKT